MNVTKAMAVRISEGPSPVQNMKDLKQLDSVEYSSYLGSLLTIDASSTHMELNSGLSRQSSIQQEKDSFYQQIELKFKEETSEVYIWSTALCGAENWALWKVYQKYLENFEMCCWRRMEKISWTKHVRNEELLHSTEEEWNTLRTIKQNKAD